MNYIKFILVVSFFASLCISAPIRSVWSEGTWQHITEADGVTIGYVRTIACATDGNVWCGGDDGVCRYSKGKWEHMLDGYVLALTIDHEGTVWVSRAEELFAYMNDSWTTCLSEEYRESMRYFVDMAATPDGGIWGANEHGISRYLNGEWTLFTTQDGLPTNTMSIVEATPKGTVWCAIDRSFPDTDKPARTGHVKYDNGVSCYNGETWTTYTTIHGLPSNYIYGIAAGGGDSVYVSTGTGIALFDGVHWKTILPRFGGKISLDSRGTLWAMWTSSDGELSSYRNGVWVDHGKPTFFGQSNLGVDPNGTVWIAGSGVTRYVPSPVGVSESPPRPVVIDITGNYPNPFNPVTSIEIIASDDCVVALSIYSMAGQCIRRYSPVSVRAGSHLFLWDGKDDRGNAAASGCYLACFQTGAVMKSHHMTLVK